jgi:uncharacterized membrane protein YccC
VIACAELVWIATAWPSGPTFITWAALTVILFAPREDAAFSMAANNMIGSAITAVLAAVAAFAILPQQSTFFGFCGAIGLVLVPAGALAAQPWRQPIFEATAAYFIPLLAPTNPMTYDPGQFYNMALAVLGGIAAAVCALRLLPRSLPRRALAACSHSRCAICAGSRTDLCLVPQPIGRGMSMAGFQRCQTGPTCSTPRNSRQPCW